MDRGAWWAPVHGVTKSDTPEQLSTHTHICGADSHGYACAVEMKRRNEAIHKGEHEGGQQREEELWRR